MDNSIYADLFYIQQHLSVPKVNENKFGGYKYRNAEDILEQLKPILKERNCIINLSDSIEVKGDRYYVLAIATLINQSGASMISSAYAREEETKKGMDSSQITGAASSYARKYALNGLFGIDDGKDSDATNDHGKSEIKKPEESENQRQHFDYDSSEFDASPPQPKTINISPKTGNKYGLCSKCGLFAVSEKSMKYADDNAKDWVCFKCNEKANK